MSWSSRVSIAAFLFSINQAVIAQVIDDGCNAVLQYSARNYSVESTDIGIAIEVYENYCEKDQAKSGSETNVGLSAVIKAVPAKFNLGSGSTSERTRHFCRTFDSDFRQNEALYRSVSRVSDETTKAWLSCKNLAAKGIAFRPQIGQTLAVIEVARTNAESAKVTGITYDSKLLACSVPDTDQSQKTSNADQDTRKSLTAEYWPITCRRTPHQYGSETVYPKVDLSISTTKGALLVPIAADAQFPYQWSSELSQRVEESNQKNEELRERLAQTEAALEALSTGLMAGGTTLPKRDARLNAETHCPPGHYMVGLWHKLDGGGPHGITSWIEAACQPLGVPRK